MHVCADFHLVWNHSAVHMYESFLSPVKSFHLDGDNDVVPTIVRLVQFRLTVMLCWQTWMPRKQEKKNQNEIADGATKNHPKASPSSLYRSSSLSLSKVSPSDPHTSIIHRKYTYIQQQQQRGLVRRPQFSNNNNPLQLD